MFLFSEIFTALKPFAKKKPRFQHKGIVQHKKLYLVWFYFSYYIKIKKIINISTTIIIPAIVNHTSPFFSKNETNGLPNFTVRYATIKNLNPREIRQITIHK